MQDNPYSALLNTLRVDTDARQPVAWRLGVVESVAPLVVRAGGIPLSGADLLCNAQLLPNTETVSLSEINGNLDGAVDCTAGSITKLAVTGGTLAASGLFGGVLVLGDTVALLQSADMQQFIILCKLVSA